ncbi:MAG: sulfotransferase [Paracoccaceae bacterium]|jgi:tetratricopeptide (TPR) repeat protein|nr:sulfotransferase [Paracoccaceae bacterium]
MAKTSANTVIAKAKSLEQAGKFKKASDTYASVLKAGVHSPIARDGFLRSVARTAKPPVNKAAFQASINSIAQQIQHGAFIQADKQSAALLRTYPNNILLLNMGGVANLGLGRPAVAREMLNLALALKPDYADAHQNLGLALQQTGMPEAALESFERAVKFNPGFAKAYDNIGSMHQYFGRFDEALDFHKKSLEIDPTSLEARRNLAVAYRNLKFYPEALTEYRAIVKAGEVSALNYYGISTLLRKLEKPAEALVEIEKALELEPNMVEAHQERGNCLRLLSRRAEAEDCYRKAIALKPASARAYFALSSVVKFQKDDPEVPALLALVDHPDHNLEEQSLIKFSLAYAYENFADLEKSFVYLKSANALRKEFMGYSFETDQKLFADIKARSGEIDALKVPQSQNPHGISPIFILGMPRSGTTLTEQIISAHPDVSGCGELNFASQYGMSIARGTSEITPEILARFREDYLNAVSTLAPGTAYFTDKMPHNFRLLGLLAKAFPEAKFVHTNRDAAATCWSNFYISFGSNGLGYCYDLEDLVAYYGLYQDMMEFWRERYSDRIYELDYEKLTQDQNAVTRDLIASLGIGWDDACLAPEKNKRNVLTASYSQVKKSVYTGSSQKWKRYEPFLDGAFDKLA